MYKVNKLSQFCREYDLDNQGIWVVNEFVQQSNVEEIVIRKLSSFSNNKIIYIPFKYKKLKIRWERI